MVIRNDMTIEKLKLNMEAIKWKSEKFEVTAEMISAGYIEINTKDIVRDSITAHVGRLAIFKDEDFTVGYGTDGKFRLTFKGEILPGQAQALEAGDTIRVSYLVK
jgi:flagellar basal body rod protein FlgF